MPETRRRGGNVDTDRSPVLFPWSTELCLVAPLGKQLYELVVGAKIVPGREAGQRTSFKRAPTMAWGSWSPGTGVLCREERKQLAGQKKGESMPLSILRATPVWGWHKIFIMSSLAGARAMTTMVSNHLRGGLCGRRND